MKKTPSQATIIMIALAIISLAFTSCGTLRGIGQDISWVGHKISNPNN